MDNFDITHRDGKPYVLIPLHDYRAAIQKDIEKHAEKYFKLQKQRTSDVPDGIHPVRYFRTQQKMTQAELAEKAGISRNYLTEIETGVKNGSVSAIKKLSEALGVSLDKLV